MITAEEAREVSSGLGRKALEFVETEILKQAKLGHCQCKVVVVGSVMTFVHAILLARGFSVEPDGALGLTIYWNKGPL